MTTLNVKGSVQNLWSIINIEQEWSLKLRSKLWHPSWKYLYYYFLVLLSNSHSPDKRAILREAFSIHTSLLILWFLLLKLVRQYIFSCMFLTLRWPQYLTWINFCVDLISRIRTFQRFRVDLFLRWNLWKKPFLMFSNMKMNKTPCFL